MEIVRAEIFKIEIPGVYASQRFGPWSPVILRLETGEGVTGLGEIPLVYGIANSAGVGMLQGLINKFVVGADPLQVEKLWNEMYHNAVWSRGGGPVVFGGLSAIDEAVLDIKGKVLDVPVFDLFGGRQRDRIQVYANNWEPGTSPEDYAKSARRVVDDGFEALKFYPIDFDSDGNEDCPTRVLSSDRLSLAVERVDAVREEVGGAVKLLVDIFGHLDPKSATQLGKELEKFDIFFYEEPVDAMNFDCLKKVANNVDIPIAAGERLYTRYGFRKYIEDQIIDLLQPDIGLTGGITETKKIADYAETYNQNVQPHNWGSPISTAVAVQLDACISNFIIQETLPYMSEKNYEIVKNPYEKNIQNGYIEIPERPGLGIKLNDDIVTEYMCLQIE